LSPRRVDYAAEGQLTNAGDEKMGSSVFGVYLPVDAEKGVNVVDEGDFNRPFLRTVAF
jgi:hypothetical protein